MCKIDIEYTKERGKHLGYPSCCIEDFIRLWDVWPKPKRKLDGTGYRPCAECNENFTVSQLVENIQAKRECPTPFPDTGSPGFRWIK